MRITFNPPPVEPAQPPIKAEHNNRRGRNSGQAEMSPVVNPAVVAIDTTWKKAWFSVVVPAA